MAWAKLDDGMPTHPKVMAAGPMAFALDVAAICYSNKHLTDGFIATHALPAVLPGMSSPKRHADKLVEVGRWDQVDTGWQIHDFHDFQPTADHQREVSRKRSEAGSKGGRRSTSKTEAMSKQNASVLLKPGPARPVPTPEQDHSSSTDVDHDDGGFEAFWRAYPARNGKKVGKRNAQIEWRKLTREQRRHALIGARHLAHSDQLPKDAERFLRRSKGGKGDFPFDDWQEPAKTAAQASGGWR